MTSLSLLQLNLKKYNSSDDFEFLIANARVTDKYFVKSVDGLGPPELNLSLPTNLYLPGYQAKATIFNRELVILLGLNPDYTMAETVADLRAAIYSLFGPYNNGPQMYVELVTTLGSLTVDAYVKKIEPNQFSKDQQIVVTVDCVSPYFSPLGATTITDLSRVDKSIHFIYEGNAVTGVHLQAQFTSPGSSFQLQNSQSNIHLHVDYPFATGDIVDVNTTHGQRTFTVNHGGDIVNLLYATSDESDWPQIYPGDIENVFTVTGGATTFNWLMGNYTPLYWGF